MQESKLECNHLTNHVAIVNTSGVISPCCQFKDFRQPRQYRTIFNTESLDFILNLGFWENIRNSLANGEKIKNCENCWIPESNGNESKRIWINKTTSPTDPYRIEDLEIGLDYTCNMMCRICKPSQSSKWNNSRAAQELYARRPNIYLKNENNDYQDKIKSLLEKSNLTNLKRIRLVGGEPFYSKNFQWLVDKLSVDCDLESLEFTLNTNGSIFPKYEILEKLLKMRKVSIDLSLDAVGNLANCIRWGVDWNTIEKNIDLWIELSEKHKNLKLNVHSTFSILNVNKIQDLINFCDQRKLHLNHTVLYDPDFLDFRQIPVDERLKWKISSDFQSPFCVEQINQSIISENSSSKKLYDFLYFTEIMDRHQKNEFAFVNDEILNLVERYKNVKY
jgi:organic radical activating enzyme